MNEIELQSMIVRLIGDGSSFQKMMLTAATQSQTAANVVQAAGKQIESVRNNLEGFARAAVGALGGLGLAGSLTSAFNAFETKEASIIRMNAALEANGRDVKATVAEYVKFSRALEQTTTSGVGNTMNLLRMAESFGLTGEHAEKATKNAVYFASALDGNAESASQYLRITQALEQGDIKRAMQMSRMIPQLRGVRDETEYLKRANALLSSGQKAGLELSNTAGNQLERLQRTFKGLSVEVGGMIAEAILPFLKAGTQLVDQFNKLDPSIKRTTAQVVLATLAFLALPSIISTVTWLYQVLGFSFVFNTAMQALNLAGWLLWSGAVLVAKGVLTIFTFFYNLFTAIISLNTLAMIGSIAITIASVAVWLVWTAIVIIAKGVVFLFNTALAITTGLWAIFTAGSLGAAASLAFWSLWAGIAKVATWLLNAALTVKNVLLAGVPLLIGLVVVAFTAFISVITVATGAVVAFIAATLALIATLVILALVATPLAVIGLTLVGLAVAAWDLVKAIGKLPESTQAAIGAVAIFQDWFAIIKDIVKAAQIDMPLAWQMVKLAALLAVLEIKDAWPVLWEFIKVGFKTLFDFVVGSMVIQFKKGLVEVALQMSKIPGFEKVFGEGVVEQLQAMKGNLDAAQVAVNGLAEAQTKAALAALQFGEGSPEAKAARVQLEALRGQLRAKEVGLAAKHGEQVGQAFSKGVGHGLEKLELTMRHGAEAVARISAWKDKLDAQAKAAGIKPQGQPGQPAPAGPNLPVVVNQIPGQAPAAANPYQKIETLLTDIKVILMNKQPLEVKPAQVG